MKTNQYDYSLYDILVYALWNCCSYFIKC